MFWNETFGDVEILVVTSRFGLIYIQNSFIELLGYLKMFPFDSFYVDTETDFLLI